MDRENKTILGNTLCKTGGVKVVLCSKWGEVMLVKRPNIQIKHIGSLNTTWWHLDLS